MGVRRSPQIPAGSRGHYSVAIPVAKALSQTGAAAVGRGSERLDMVYDLDHRWLKGLKTPGERISQGTSRWCLDQNSAAQIGARFVWTRVVIVP